MLQFAHRIARVGARSIVTIEPDLKRRVYWTMVLANTLVSLKQAPAACATQHSREAHDANAATSEDWELDEHIASLHISSIRVEAQFSGADADELGKHRDSLLTNAGEIMVFNSERRLDLSVAWNRGGQRELKSRAASRGTDRPQTPTVRLND